MKLSKAKRELIKQKIEFIQARCNEMMPEHDDTVLLIENLELIDEAIEGLLYSDLYDDIITFYKEH
jgi:hypothetical protein